MTPPNVNFLFTKATHVTVKGLAKGLGIKAALTILSQHKKIDLGDVKYLYIRYEGDKAELIFCVKGDFQTQYIQADLFAEFKLDLVKVSEEDTLPNRKEIPWYSSRGVGSVGGKGNGPATGKGGSTGTGKLTLNSYLNTAVGSGIRNVEPQSFEKELKKQDNSASQKPKAAPKNSQTQVNKATSVMMEDIQKVVAKQLEEGLTKLREELDARDATQAVIQQQALVLSNKTSDNSLQISQVKSFANQLMLSMQEDRAKVEQVNQGIIQLGSKVETISDNYDAERIAREEELKKFREEQRSEFADIRSMLISLSSSLGSSGGKKQKVPRNELDIEEEESSEEMEVSQYTTVTKNKAKKPQSAGTNAFALLGSPAAKKNSQQKNE
jgi:hypothetical protein